MKHLQQAEQVLRSFDAPQQDGSNAKNIGEVVTLKFGDITGAIPAKITGMHLYSAKIKYDLELAVLFEDGWHTTRIYNVDSKFVFSRDVTKN